MDTKTIVFVHGTGGHNADWLPSIGEELDKRGLSFKTPALPNTKPIQVDNWLDGLHNTVRSIGGPVVFVGYSLGTRTVLLYLEKYGIKVSDVFLVAAFSNDTANAEMDDGEYASFFTHKINIETIKKNVDRITILHSEDDWSIPYEQAVELSENLDAKLITYKDKGHFTDPTCSVDILEVLESRLRAQS